MPVMHCAQLGRLYIGYRLFNAGQGSQAIQGIMSEAEANWLAVIYGITEYFNKWNKELDSRAYDNLTTDDDEDVQKVAEPSRFTQRQLPAPLEVCISDHNFRHVLSYKSESYVYPLNCRKYWRTLQQMTSNVEVKYSYIPIKENEAYKILRRL